MSSDNKFQIMKFRSRKMQWFYVFGVVLIFLVSFSKPTSSPDKYDKYLWKKWSDGDDDYYDDDYSNEITNNETINNLSNTSSSNKNRNIIYSNIDNSSSSSSSGSSTLENITTIIQNIPDIPNLLNLAGTARETKSVEEEEQCPSQCNCSEDFQFVNCTNRKLLNVPKALPNEAIRIDLSHNLIKELNENDLQKLILLREINLEDNEISKIDEEVFFGLRQLEVINLANNKLSNIHPDTFSDVIDLIKLDLSTNPLQLPKDESFLNQPNLKELNIQHTGIGEIYEKTFYNLSRLTSLSMDKNNFNQKINIRAFEPMKNLAKLQLPELEQTIITELCQLLTTIDDIYFGNYVFSCYELSAGSSFNDSLRLITPNPDTQESQLPSIKGVITTAGTRKPTKAGQKLKNMNSTNATDLDENVAAVDKEEEDFITAKLIDYMLIGIVVIAVVGLLIGVVCRKDYCGIKTKMCRTKKNRRPPTTDQVRPAEEIPLNKV